MRLSIKMCNFMIVFADGTEGLERMKKTMMMYFFLLYGEQIGPMRKVTRHYIDLQ